MAHPREHQMLKIDIAGFARTATVFEIPTAHAANGALLALGFQTARCGYEWHHASAL